MTKKNVKAVRTAKCGACAVAVFTELENGSLLPFGFVVLSADGRVIGYFATLEEALRCLDALDAQEQVQAHLQEQQQRRRTGRERGG